MKKLNINDNTVTERGALAIGEALENCKNLETLDMGDCLIRNKGNAIENMSKNDNYLFRCSLFEQKIEIDEKFENIEFELQ